MLGCLFRLFLLAVGLFSGALSVGAFYVGQQAHWTSDGPGMLFVMLAIPFFGFISLACLGGALGMGSSGDPD